VIAIAEEESMFQDTRAFAGFSTNDIEKAKEFYGRTLGLKYTEEMGNISLDIAGGGQVLIYPKDNHEPATFTVLNFPVPDINTAVERLTASGIELERYEGFDQDERGIMRGFGPPIAWFKDPAGNILSVLETQGA
jgi:catechol 2,3-dioxygenase-like lactoylglutathione lyase family enzyme